MSKPAHFIGWFYDEVFRANIYLLWPVTPKDIARFIKREFGVEHRHDHPFDGRCVEIGGEAHGSDVICLREWQVSPKWIAVLAHECFHAAEQILTERGVCFDNSPAVSNETHAYLHESIVRRCLEKLMPTKRR